MKQSLKGQVRKNKMDKVLVVDDDESFLNLICLVLSEKFLIRTARNCGEAMEVLKEGNFDALILDVSLTDYSGYYLAEQVRKIDTKIPIAFLTNYDSEVTRENAVSVGACLWEKSSMASDPKILLEEVNILINV